jgi:hypothetical protein
VGGAAVFKKKEALPGAEGELAVEDGDDFGATGECHADVAWHVVRAFMGVDEIGQVFRDKVVEVGVQIGAGGGVCVFKDDEGTAGVPHKNGGYAALDAAAVDDAVAFVGDFVGSFAAGGNRKKLCKCCHQLFINPKLAVRKKNRSKDDDKGCTEQE